MSVVGGYDIGNDFYNLWLDRDAHQYTCAYFADPSMTIEQAQQAKMHHVCRKLQLKPGETVVEAGSGWGGFALFMAQNYGVRLTFDSSAAQDGWVLESSENSSLGGTKNSSSTTFPLSRSTTYGDSVPQNGHISFCFVGFHSACAPQAGHSCFSSATTSATVDPRLDPVARTNPLAAVDRSATRQIEQNSR